MEKGTLIKVHNRLATTVSENYTRMVYDSDDFELASAGFNGGSACSFVDVVFTDTTVQAAINLSRTPWIVVK